MQSGFGRSFPQGHSNDLCIADLLFKPGGRFNGILVIRIDDKCYVFINLVVTGNGNLGRRVGDVFDANVDLHLHFQVVAG